MDSTVAHLIDSWLAAPATCDFGDCNIPGVLEALEVRLYDAWEHNRDDERQRLLKLRDALLAHSESLTPVEAHDDQTCAAVAGAILQVWALIAATPFSHRSGSITIQGRIFRNLTPCPLCGVPTTDGVIDVQHADGRAMGFRAILAHYAEAGHPLKRADVDTHLLLSLMADV